MEWYNIWLEQLKKDKIKYFVLKVEDLFGALNDANFESNIFMFNRFLEKYNKFREPKPINKYWVVNRDDYNIESIEEFLKILENHKK